MLFPPALPVIFSYTFSRFKLNTLGDESLKSRCCVNDYYRYILIWTENVYQEGGVDLGMKNMPDKD